MKRALNLLIQLAVTAVVAWLGAYGFLYMQVPAAALIPTGTTALVATREGRGIPSASASDVAISFHGSREQPAAIVSYRDAVARAAPSVVTVHSARTSKGPLGLAQKTVARGLGSGVIVDRDGYIVTNYHVVEDATELAVALADGSLQLARLAGVDAESDIALLKIDADNLRPITLTDIDDVAVGDVVLAVGNPLGVGQTVTQGIVSAIVRKGVHPTENFIQTDAAINPGNSGGALIDTGGRLVGINTLILSHSGGSEGIGFAIPVDYVQTIAATLKAKGHVARAWLGVATGTPPHGNGALVVTVEHEGPADRAGIAAGDVIVRIGERSVEHPQDLRGVVVGAEPGMRVPIEFSRNGKRATVEVELAPLPTRQPAG
jgi:S1-C subfamily serine protease